MKHSRHAQNCRVAFETRVDSPCAMFMGWLYTRRRTAPYLLRRQDLDFFLKPSNTCDDAAGNLRQVRWPAFPICRDELRSRRGGFNPTVPFTRTTLTNPSTVPERLLSLRSPLSYSTRTHTPTICLAAHGLVFVSQLCRHRAWPNGSRASGWTMCPKSNA